MRHATWVSQLRPFNNPRKITIYHGKPKFNSQGWMMTVGRVQIRYNNRRMQPEPKIVTSPTIYPLLPAHNPYHFPEKGRITIYNHRFICPCYQSWYFSFGCMVCHEYIYVYPRLAKVAKKQNNVERTLWNKKDCLYNGSLRLFSPGYFILTAE